MIKRYVISAVVALVALVASAQQHIPCDRSLRDGRVATRAAGTRVASSMPLTGTVNIPVILAAYPDVPFSQADDAVAAVWDAKLNQSGYAEHGAYGCVADYFRQQSRGELTFVFDVIGPVELPRDRSYYGTNRSGTTGDDKAPEQMIKDACSAAGKDFSPYDNDGDGVVDMVMVVFAGQGENRGGPADAIWPHKFTLGTFRLGEVGFHDYACVSELDAAGADDGFGTFIHEFSHGLGLPDLYPSDKQAYSYFDEWDLMDGGNYANGGWSPPNFSAFERHLCGWLDFIELTEAVSVSDMPDFDGQPVAYVIRNDEDPEQYYILENRQQRGWDGFVPGNGLLVTLVDHFNYTLFPNRSVKNPQVILVTADNHTYREDEAFYGVDTHHTADRHNLIFSRAAYPYVMGDSINDRLTDTSIPAMLFSKPVTNICQSADGKISFDFMKEVTAIAGARTAIATDEPIDWYDLNGRRLQGAPVQRGIYIVRYADGTTKKCIR